MQALINQRFIETGEKERLKDLLRTKLVECNWRDNMKTLCRGL
jgi:enhancer of yellow 2 transcription factor